KFISAKVSLSAAATQTVTVNFATADGTATVADGDYVATSGTLSFAPGVVSKTIKLTINGDTKTEPDETFFVNLTNAVNATLDVAQGVVTLLNDDLSLSIGNASVTEGDSGLTNADFVVTLSAPASFPVTVPFSTVAQTAKAGL